MIFIDRDAKDEHNNPIKPNDDWFHRAEELTARAKREGQTHHVTSHYSDPEVKKALEKLFHGKCAYCEQELGETWDVEHFRPKKGVKEDIAHPGYYWLSYEWKNLYASCHACNAVITDIPTWDDDREGVTAGKGTQFPLLPTSQRACNPNDNYEDEKPLLLDPCEKGLHPETLILYGLDGQPFAFDNDPRASATIEICHLKRRRHRKKVREAIMNFIATMDRNHLISDVPDQHPFAGALKGVLNDPARFGLTSNQSERVK